MTILYGSKRKAVKVLAAVLAGAALQGCSLMHDDLDPCAVKPNTFTSVKFRYDYNTRATDLFQDRVGAVTLYVFDKDGKYVTDVERCNTLHSNALASPDFKIDFDSEVIKPGNTYRFYAVGHENPGGYEALLTKAGFRRLAQLGGENFVEDYAVAIQCDDNGEVLHDGELPDALWVTLQGQTLEVPEERIPEEGDPQEPDHMLEANVPLMRVTNDLTVCFWQSDFPTAINPEHYEISIVCAGGHGTLDIVGEPRAQQPLTYRPFNVWKETRTIDGEVTACLCARFGLSRLIKDCDMTVIVKNTETGDIQRLERLPRYLAMGNEAYSAYNWGDQEYLDREYEYAIQFPFDGGIPKWVQINIDILAWSKRVQNEVL